MSGILIKNVLPHQSVVGKHDGGTYAFRPGECREIFNTYAARHLINRWGKYGLVDITYDDRLAKKYATPELLVHERTVDGLMKYLDVLTEVDSGFETYDNECDDKKTVERMRFKNKRKDVAKEIQLITDTIEKMSSIDTETIMRESAESLKRQAEALMVRAKALEKQKHSDKASNG